MPAIDLDNVLLTPSVTARSPLDRMVFTSRNQRRVPLQFYRANLTGACEIPLGSSAQILIKRQGDFSSEAALARALTWEKEGQGAAAVYWFLLDLNTNEMNSIFLGEAEMRTDLIFEVTLQIEGRTYTPPRVPCTVWRRYLAGNEGQPTPANPDWPLPSEVVTDAPQDGKAYVRQDGVWVEKVWDSTQIIFAARYGDDPLDVYNDGESDLGTLIVTETNQHSSVPYNKIDEDPTSGWNAVTKAFTVPADGVYIVVPYTLLIGLPASVLIWATLHFSGAVIGIDLKSYGDPLAEGGDQTAGYGGVTAIGSSWVGHLAAGDTVKVAVYTGYGGVYVAGSFYPTGVNDGSYIKILKL